MLQNNSPRFGEWDPCQEYCFLFTKVSVSEGASKCVYFDSNDDGDVTNANAPKGNLFRQCKIYIDMTEEEINKFELSSQILDHNQVYLMINHMDYLLLLPTVISSLTSFEKKLYIVYCVETKMEIKLVKEYKLKLVLYKNPTLDFTSIM